MLIFQASGLASCAATFCWCFGFPWVQRGLFPLRSLRLPSAISPSVTVTFMSKIVHRVVCCQPHVAVFLSALVGAAHMPQKPVTILACGKASARLWQALSSSHSAAVFPWETEAALSCPRAGGGVVSIRFFSVDSTLFSVLNYISYFPH